MTLLVHTVAGLLDIVPISRNRLYQLLESGELIGTQVGTKWLVTDHHLREFLSLPLDPETDNDTEPELGAAGESVELASSLHEVGGSTAHFSRVDRFDCEAANDD